MVSPSERVIEKIEGFIGWLIFNNPERLNVVSLEMWKAIYTILDRYDKNPDVRVIVLCGAGDNAFTAGADITEFGKPAQPPSLPDILDRLEALAKPVVAAIHGNALGGGLETALAAHYRIALRDARIGLPEVKLGLLPGAGGTQRAPRLMGVKAALDFMIKGQAITATEALAMGLLDRVCDGDLRAAALDYAQELVAAGAKPRPSRAIVPDLEGIDAAWFAAQRVAVSRGTRGAAAPQRIVDAVELGVSCAPAEAATRTRAMFIELMHSTESRALRHLFFAEREAARLPADCKVASRRAVTAVAVIGGGTMGAGIAINFADHGFPVLLLEMDAVAAERGLARRRRPNDLARTSNVFQRLDFMH